MPSNQVIAYGIFAFIIISLWFFPRYGNTISLFPFIALCLAKSKTSLFAGALLATVWAGYLCLLFSPIWILLHVLSYCFTATEILYYVPELGQQMAIFVTFLANTMSNHYILCLYTPLFVVLYVKTETLNPVSLALQTALWDYPLLLWMRLAAAAGIRALSVS